MLDVCDKEQETGRASTELLRKGHPSVFPEFLKGFYFPIFVAHLLEGDQN